MVIQSKFSFINYSDILENFPYATITESHLYERHLIMFDD